MPMSEAFYLIYSLIKLYYTKALSGGIPASFTAQQQPFNLRAVVTLLNRTKASGQHPTSVIYSKGDFGGKKNLLITLTFSFYTYKMRKILINRKFHKAVMRLKMVLHNRNLY